MSELRLSLDHGSAPELSDKLNALYLFVEQEIRDAFLDRMVAPIANAKDVLNTLLDGWKQVEIDLDRA